MWHPYGSVLSMQQAIAVLGCFPCRRAVVWAWGVCGAPMGTHIILGASLRLQGGGYNFSGWPAALSAQRLQLATPPTRRMLALPMLAGLHSFVAGFACTLRTGADVCDEFTSGPKRYILRGSILRPLDGPSWRTGQRGSLAFPFVSMPAARMQAHPVWERTLD